MHEILKETFAWMIEINNELSVKQKKKEMLRPFQEKVKYKLEDKIRQIKDSGIFEDIC